MMGNNFFVGSLIAGLLLVSCERDNFLEGGIDGDELCFIVSQGDIESKGSLCDDIDDITSIGVMGYCKGQTYIDNMPLSRYGETVEELWSFSPPIYWPDSEVTFIAYSPYLEGGEDNGSGVTITSSGDKFINLQYIMPQDVTLQPDLMVTSTITSEEGNIPNLNFKHLLSAISFSIEGGADLVIDSIRVSNIYDQAEFRIDSDGVRTTLAEQSDQWYSPGIIDSEIESDSQTSITTNSGYLMIPPQTLDSSTTVELYIKGEDSPRELSLEQSIECLSSMVVDLGITLDGTSASLGLPTIPSDGDYSDLPPSNCYIIPAHYTNQSITIPIEERINTFWGYGYSSDTAPYEYDENRQITDWNIVEAELLWHDIDFSGSNHNINTINFYIQRVSGKGVLKFTVQSDFPQGNVVVGITQNGYLLWSWHFWFTDYLPYGDVVDSGDKYCYNISNGTGVVHRYKGDIWESGGVYNQKYIMDRNIGANYSESDNGGENGSLLYQFGRKDPFPTAAAYYTLYESYTPFDGECSDEVTSIATAVTSPTVVCSEEDWIRNSGSKYRYNRNEVNVWNDPLVTLTEDDATSVAVDPQKSIFDPSPYGWKLASNNTWDDLTNCELTYTSSGIIYTIDGSAIKAYYPAVGFGYMSTLLCKGSMGGIWSFMPYENSEAYNYSFMLEESDIEEASSRYRDEVTNAFSVRCVTE